MISPHPSDGLTWHSSIDGALIAQANLPNTNVLFFNAKVSPLDPPIRKRPHRSELVRKVVIIEGRRFTSGFEELPDIEYPYLVTVKRPIKIETYAEDLDKAKYIVAFICANELFKLKYCRHGYDIPAREREFLTDLETCDWMFATQEQLHRMNKMREEKYG